MDIFGLDLSLTSTGIAFPDDTTCTLAPKGVSGPARLDWFYEMLRVLIPGGSRVVVEGYSFASSNSHSHALGELGGIVRWDFWKRDVSYVLVPPTCRAKFATGKGNAGKVAVVSAVSARTGLIWASAGGDDEADAFILQEMGLAHFGRARYRWPAENLKGLDKVDWSPFEG